MNEFEELKNEIFDKLKLHTILNPGGNTFCKSDYLWILESYYSIIEFIMNNNKIKIDKEITRFYIEITYKNNRKIYMQDITVFSNNALSVELTRYSDEKYFRDITKILILTKETTYEELKEFLLNEIF